MSRKVSPDQKTLLSFLDFKNVPTKIPSRGLLPVRFHVFDESSIEAVNTAIAARRPLLVRGEPGGGKSQLAKAVAHELGCGYVQYVVDSQSESRDLLWRFDAVRRLADAQLQGTFRGPEASSSSTCDPREIANYVEPGPLWWAFDWKDARNQAKRSKTPEPFQEEGAEPLKGSVLLIDEIDKADSDLPNGLLEALGDGQFLPPGRSKPVEASSLPPLTVITTNEERFLPDAFLRRCIVLRIDLFDSRDGETPKERLIQRGRANFQDLDQEVLDVAAKLLIDDRKKAKESYLRPLPGLAEYLDLLRVVQERAKGDGNRQKELIEKVRPYIFWKAGEPGL